MAKKRRQRTNKNVPAKGRLRDMADQLWSLAVRADWGNRCAVCGAQKCEAHHLVPRQHQRTRYDLMTGIALCAAHHQFDVDISPHQNAAGWMQWLEDHHPERHKWLVETVEWGRHRNFDGVTNADYYCEQIWRLREYVDEDDFRTICGQRFSEWLREAISGG